MLNIRLIEKFIRLNKIYKILFNQKIYKIKIIIFLI